MRGEEGGAPHLRSVLNRMAAPFASRDCDSSGSSECKVVTRRKEASQKYVTLDNSRVVILNASVLKPYFSLPLHEAAKALGVCATALKKVCRKIGVQNWPYRKIKALDKKISTYAEDRIESNEDTEREKRSKPAIQSLKDSRERLMKPAFNPTDVQKHQTVCPRSWEAGLMACDSGNNVPSGYDAQPRASAYGAWHNKMNVEGTVCSTGEQNVYARLEAGQQGCYDNFIKETPSLAIPHNRATRPILLDSRRNFAQWEKHFQATKSHELPAHRTTSSQSYGLHVDHPYPRSAASSHARWSDDAAHLSEQVSASNHARWSDNAASQTHQEAISSNERWSDDSAFQYDRMDASNQARCSDDSARSSEPDCVYFPSTERHCLAMAFDHRPNTEMGAVMAEPAAPPSWNRALNVGGGDGVDFEAARGDLESCVAHRNQGSNDCSTQPTVDFDANEACEAMFPSHADADGFTAPASGNPPTSSGDPFHHDWTFW